MSGVSAALLRTKCLPMSFMLTPAVLWQRGEEDAGLPGSVGEGLHRSPLLSLEAREKSGFRLYDTLVRAVRLALTGNISSKQ